MYDGLLLVDKPLGWTSFDVVAKVRGMMRQSDSPAVRQFNSQESKELHDSGTVGLTKRKFRVGHTGTLDPLATGLLVLVLGNYCKRAQEFSKLDKTYEVAMRLGMTSSTGDEEGEKTVVSSPFDRLRAGKQPAVSEIREVLERFSGETMQTPPAFSAIKVNGQRAYKLARAGLEVKLEPRKVRVNGIQLTAYRYPEVTFTAEVSSGTYIRSLVEDIGKDLGTGAYMSGLVRTRVGQFKLSDAVWVEGLDDKIIEQKLITFPEQSL